MRQSAGAYIIVASGHGLNAFIAINYTFVSKSITASLHHLVRSNQALHGGPLILFFDMVSCSLSPSTKYSKLCK